MQDNLVDFFDTLIRILFTKVEKSFVINHDSITDRAQLVSDPQSASLAPLVP